MPARRNPLSLCILPALAALLAAPAARAEEPPALFGARGQVALDDIVGLSGGGSRYGYPLTLPLALGTVSYGFSGVLGYSRNATGPSPTNLDGSQGTASTVWMAPSFDVFVRDRLSIGGAVSASYGWGERTTIVSPLQTQHMEGRGYAYAIVPRIGYAIPFGPSFALWPRLGLGLTGGSTNYASNMAGGDFRSESHTFIADIELGLVARVHRYIYVRASPDLMLRLGRSQSTVSSGQENTIVSVGATAGLGILLGS
jgi:hypothetical protein